MADEQPPKIEDVVPDPQQPGNVISLAPALLRKRVLDAMAVALQQWSPATTIDVSDQMTELDIGMSQILHGMKRADILSFSEDVPNGRMLFTAKLMSAGEEFFVSASIEHLVPFAGSHVVIKRVWR